MTGCGSTVSVSGLSSSGASSTADGLSGALDVAPAVPAAAPGSTVLDSPTQAPDEVQAASEQQAPGTDRTPVSAASPAVSGAVPATGKGWDQKFVYVGVVTTNDTARIYSSLGAKNLDPGDAEGQANAMVKDLNAKGGVLGRQLKVAFYDIKTLDTASNPDATAQAVCTHFTQDRPVVAVYTQNTQLDVATLHQCFAKAKVALFSAGTPAKEDSELHQLAPYFISLAMASWDHVAPALVARLGAQGWFGGWNTTTGTASSAKAKVGILVDGTNQGARTGKALQSALAKAGHPGALVASYDKASDGQSASVNYFKGNGVTHVIVTSVELTAFQSSASTQAYKPRYGITSYNDPYTNLEASGLTPKGANNGALGIGWAPSYDVSDANAPGLSAGEQSCMKAQQAGGQSFGGNRRIARGFAESVCDFFYLVVRGAKAGHGLTGTIIGSAASALGASYSPAISAAAALSNGRYYVPGKARDLGWVSSCSCFRYGAGSITL